MDEWLDKIFCMDALEGLKSLPDKSVDLIITSPPYNMCLERTGVQHKNALWKGSTFLLEGYDFCADNMPYDEYVKWQRNILTECMRVLKEDGACFYNHKYRMQNGLLETRHSIVDGFPLRQIIIWDGIKIFNFNGTAYGNAYEVIFLFAKPNFRLKKGGAGFGDVWHIPHDIHNDHPAAFPAVLVNRIITTCASSCSSKIVLDPFMGSGTTAVCAKLNGDHYIGFEISETYCDLARKRIDRNDEFMSEAKIPYAEHNGEVFKQNTL